jgi:hypothetical protein
MRSALILSLCVFLGACASSGEAAARRAAQNQITQEEIVASGADTIYELIKELRRGWLPFRSGTFIIVADENLSVLDRIRAEDNLDAVNRDTELLRPGGAASVSRLEWKRGVQAQGMFPAYTSADLNTFLGAIIIYYR